MPLVQRMAMACGHRHVVWFGRVAFTLCGDAPDYGGGGVLREAEVEG